MVVSQSRSNQNFDAPNIADPSAHFTTLLDTGANIKTASEAEYTYQLAWIKDRDNANNHQLIDTVRGMSAVLQSNSTSAETTYSAPFGNSVAWVWNLNEAGSSNTGGSITATVAANTTSGISVATFTGTAANATVGHGLSGVDMAIFKNRTDADAYAVYHSANTAAPETNYLVLNTSAATAADATYWNNTPPTIVTGKQRKHRHPTGS